MSARIVSSPLIKKYFYGQYNQCTILSRNGHVIEVNCQAREVRTTMAWLKAVFIFTMDYGVPGSSPSHGAVRCGLEEVTFTPCLALVKSRKRWMCDRLEQTVTSLETTLCLMC